MSEEFSRRVGAELEGFLYEGNLPAPLDMGQLEQWNSLARQQGIPGRITVDAGVGHIEFVTDPLRSSAEILRTFFALRELIPTMYDVHFVNRRPGSSYQHPTPWIKLPRFEALLNAVSLYCPDGWKKVLCMSDFSSGHVTVEIAPDSPGGVVLINYVNLVGPWIARHLSSEFSADNTGHLDAWLGWMSQEYLPDPERWFGSPEDMISFFESLGALVREVPGSAEELLSGNKTSSQWVIDLQMRKHFGCKADEGTLWWFARPRKSYASETSPGAVEIRLAPSMRPQYATQAIVSILDIVEMLLVFSAGRNFATARDAEQVFGTMHHFFPFLPKHPPSPKEWYAEIAAQTQVR